MLKLLKEMGRDIDFQTSFEGLWEILHNSEVFVYEHLLKLPQGKFPVPKFITSMKDLRTFCGGKLSDKVAKVEEVVQDIMDPDWIDQLADELGTI
ncbi:unnamed protein product [Strongylus vulgaris]|uniref:Uncharacterized protein n=1 Tax=Strongylus vulgaris TaxID=40348 RepID=A0A3P7LDJ6_STRVU|nr:unnamed protein product [Strongylus vulgaris]